MLLLQAPQTEFDFVQQEVSRLVSIPWALRLADTLQEEFGLASIKSWKRRTPSQILILGSTLHRCRLMFDFLYNTINQNDLFPGWCQKRSTTMTITFPETSVWQFSHSLLSCRGKNLDIALYEVEMAEIALPEITPCMW